MKRARVVTKIQIAATPATVFTYLDDLNHHKEWNPHLTSIQPLVKLAEGVTYQTVSSVMGVKVRSKIVVKELVPGKKLTIESKTGLLQYCITYQLKPAEGGTLLRCTTLVSAEGRAFAFARPLLSELANREINRDLQALKQAAEQ